MKNIQFYFYILITFIIATSFSFENRDDNKRVISTSNSSFTLIGTEKGLYYTDEKSILHSLILDNVEIKKIIRVSNGIYLLTDNGIIFTDDLKGFSFLNEGLPLKVLKSYRNNQKILKKISETLIDLEIDPNNPNNMITCSKNMIYYSMNAGKTWKFLYNPFGISGIKTVGIISNPDLEIFIGHSYKGIFKKSITKNTNWTDISNGLYVYSGIYEEVSDIMPVPDTKGYSLLSSNNFTPQIYLYDKADKKWITIYKDAENFGIIENLNLNNNILYYVSNNNIKSIDLAAKSPIASNYDENFKNMINEFTEPVQSVLSVKDNENDFAFSELWLINERDKKQNLDFVNGKKGFYVSAGVLNNKNKFAQVIDTLNKSRLNMVVVDMKDDWGNLRFKPESEVLKKIRHTSSYVDIENLTKTLHEKNIYIIARLVLFKDFVLYNYNKNEYAIKDQSNDAWRGIKTLPNGTKELIEEYWVDPYCEKVWEYNMEIAKELAARGFDEIQFDYVRFPTDGENIADAVYTYRDKGMDKESALISFFEYVRENLDAPISIDIYGANGWHRIGSIGQDIEALSKYVDAICPMFYPSHFGNGFLNFKPYEERTFRIYYYGSLRNYYIGKKRSVVRPYVQAFRLNTQYDMDYYSINYIANEIKGVTESVNQGLTFWNMNGHYDMVSKLFTD